MSFGVSQRQNQRGICSLWHLQSKLVLYSYGRTCLLPPVTTEATTWPQAWEAALYGSKWPLLLNHISIRGPLAAAYRVFSWHVRRFRIRLQGKFIQSLFGLYVSAISRTLPEKISQLLLSCWWQFGNGDRSSIINDMNLVDPRSTGGDGVNWSVSSWRSEICSHCNWIL